MEGVEEDLQGESTGEGGAWSHADKLVIELVCQCASARARAP